MSTDETGCVRGCVLLYRSMSWFTYSCVACSLADGCYPYSDLVDESWYQSRVIDTSPEISTPYTVLDTIRNPGSTPMTGVEYSYTDVSGQGIVSGLTWRLIQLGYKEYTERQTTATCRFTIAPKSKVSIAQAFKYRDQKIEFEWQIVMYCLLHKQLWTIPTGTSTATERNSWTAISLTEEPL